MPEFRGQRQGEAFKEVYGPITFHRSAKTHYTDSDGVQHRILYGAETFGRRVEFYDPAFGASALAFRNNVVHELAHVFNYVTVVESLGKYGQEGRISPYDDLQVAIENGNLPPREVVRDGMSPGDWQQHPHSDINGELFADGFLNHIYGTFRENSAGDMLSNWFDINMAAWATR